MGDRNVMGYLNGVLWICRGWRFDALAFVSAVPAAAEEYC